MRHLIICYVVLATDLILMSYSPKQPETHKHNFRTICSHQQLLRDYEGRGRVGKGRAAKTNT